MKKTTAKIILLVLLMLAGAWAVGLIPTQEAQALGQRQAVIYIRAIAADLGLTPTQVENLTRQQAYDYLIAEYPSLPVNKLRELSDYWSAIKIMVWRDAVAREIAANEIIIQDGLATLFPGVVVDWGHPRVREARYVLAVVARGDPNAL